VAICFCKVSTVESRYCFCKVLTVESGYLLLQSFNR
jgi:hypothetical protein